MPGSWALVGQPVRGIQPVIDTGPGHLKPASRFGLAASPRTKSSTRLRQFDEQRIFQLSHLSIPMSRYL